MLFESSVGMFVVYLEPFLELRVSERHSSKFLQQYSVLKYKISKFNILQADVGVLIFSCDEQLKK